MNLLAGVFIVMAAPQGEVSTSPPKELVTVEDELRRARNEYAYGDYEVATTRLKSLLYPLRLNTDEQVKESRRLLGLCYYLLDQQDEAKDEFYKLLLREPDYRLDPLTVSPQIIEFFEAVRKQHRTELDAVRERVTQRAIETTPVGEVRNVLIERTERSDLGTFIPFGVGQFQNGDTGWGIAFAAIETALLVVNIGSFLWLRTQRFEGRPGYPASRAKVVQAVTITQFSSAALLGITWSLGVFQARLNFVPLVETRRVDEGPSVGGTLNLGGQF